MKVLLLHNKVPEDQAALSIYQHSLGIGLVKVFSLTPNMA